MIAIVAADTRDAYGDVEGVFLPVGVAVFVLVAAAIVSMVWRGRRRAAPRERHDNRPLDAAAAVLLVVIAGVLVAVSFSAEDRVGEARGKPALHVRVVAAKWRWRFEYPGRGIAIQGTEDRVPTLVVPAGADIEVEGVSIDVVHAFWIPELRFQRELFARRPTRFTLRFERPGHLSSPRCSFYCGLRHQDMRFGVEVLATQEFRAWLRSRGAGA